MNTLKFLSDRDFVLIDGKMGTNLCLTKREGITLVLFYSTTCESCERFIPQYKEVSLKFPNINFCLINLFKYKQVGKVALKTTTPIHFVPYIIFYKNDKPWMVYGDDPRSKKTIMTYNDLYRNLSKLVISNPTRQSFTKMRQLSDEEIEIIEANKNGGLGIPYNIVCDSDRCYLTLEETKYNKTCKEECDQNGCSIFCTLSTLNK
jgi:thiol-disulfide isomerase/thioredoxin